MLYTIVTKEWNKKENREKCDGDDDSNVDAGSHDEIMKKM